MPTTGRKIREIADSVGHLVGLVILWGIGLCFVVLLIVGVVIPLVQDALDDALHAPAFTGGDGSAHEPWVQGEGPDDATTQSEAQLVERWTCEWDPTMNDNYHDDVLCTRGADRDRPTLLADWSFVTQADMMAAAAEYEAMLMAVTDP